MGAPAGPFEGRDAIAADYAWAADGRRAGRIVLTPHGGEIAALTVTFE